jgi:hypothetical protein
LAFSLAGLSIKLLLDICKIAEVVIFSINHHLSENQDIVIWYL